MRQLFTISDNLRAHYEAEDASLRGAALSRRNAMEAVGGGTERLVASESFANFDITKLHVNTPLVNVSIAYANAEFLSETIAPVIPSDKPSDDYFVYGLERFRRRDTNRAPGADFAETGWSVSPTPFVTRGHSIRGWYPWEAPSAADPAIDLDIDTTETVTDQVLLDQECALLDAIKAGVTPTDLSQTPQYQFDNPDCDPIAYIDTVLKPAVAKKIGRTPKTMVLGYYAFVAMRNNRNVIRRVYGTTAPVDPLITPTMLAEKLALKEVFVNEAMYDMANEGETPSLDYIWGDCALLSWRDPAAGRRKLNFASTFVWDLALPAAQGDDVRKNAGWIIEKWYEKKRKRMNIDVTKYYAQQLLAAGAGVLLENTASLQAGKEIGA
jgi:hypothetical protein